MFIGGVEKKFLWNGGTPKIAHHTIIASMKQGGFEYVDLQEKIKALNSKFLTSLNSSTSNRSLLPKYWIGRAFEKSCNLKAVELDYYREYFKQHINILSQCYFRIPKKSNWEGHPYYYNCMKTLQELTPSLPNIYCDLM